MPGDLISAHEVRLLLFFRRHAHRWFDNAQAAAVAEVSPRTARLHTSRLAALGILDVQRVFPASKFKLAGSPSEAGRAYLERWEKAREALGLCDVEEAAR